MILLIDNYDSFTFNLEHLIAQVRPDEAIEVHRNDVLSIDDIRRKSPSHIVISPGPCTPDEAGVSVDCIKAFAGEIPILGVCLGHQAIGQAMGASIVRAPVLMHGKTGRIEHDGNRLFDAIPSPFVATRYHSLIIDPATLDSQFRVIAWAAADDVSAAADQSSSSSPVRGADIMAIAHRQWPVFGVQFHPESYLTEHGHRLLTNFLAHKSQP